MSGWEERPIALEYHEDVVCDETAPLAARIGFTAIVAASLLYVMAGLVAVAAAVMP